MSRYASTSSVTRGFTLGLLGGGVALWLAGHAAMQAARAEPSTPSSSRSVTQVYVRDSPIAMEKIQTARDRLSRGEIGEAVRVLQTVLDQYGSRLVPRDDKRYITAREMVRRVLLDSPALLRAYRVRYQPRARRMLEAADNRRKPLTELVRRYGMTDAGARGALRLAGLRLETREPAAASILLRRLSAHPLSAEEKVRRWKLLATAALYLRQPERYAAYRAKLQNAGREQALAQLDKLATSLVLASSAAAINPLDPLPPAQPPPEANVLWTFSYSPVFVGASPFEDRLDGQRDPSWEPISIIPAAQGAKIFIQNGRTLYAVNAYSGQLIWRHRGLDSQTYRRLIRFSRYAHDRMQSADLHTVVPAGDRVLSVFGYASTSPFTSVYYHLDPLSVLTCLETATGEELWSLTPEQVHPDLESAFWCGRPIVSRGRVYMQARRRKGTQFQDAYVVALRLSDGELLWLKHISSTAVPREHFMAGVSQMLLSRGRLYINSSLGAVASLGAANGALDWLRVVPAADRDDEYAQGAWRLTQPARVAAGLVVLDKDAAVLRLLDPHTGELRRTIPAWKWGSPSYLINVGDDVLSVGKKISLRSGRTLEARWTIDPPDSRQGRAVVAGDMLYLPLEDQVRVYAISEGRRVASLDIPTPASLLPLEGQLLSVRSGKLISYSTWGLMASVLKQRIEARPSDARPLMGLIWIQCGTGHTRKVIEHVDRAVRLVLEGEKKGDASHALFEQLLAMASQLEKDDAELAEALYDRAALLIEHPGEQVRYRLAMGAFDASRERWREAVEQYQTILAQPVLRNELYHYPGGSRQAGIEAQRRLRRLIENRGPRIYARYEAYAAQRVGIILDSSDTDAHALIELARSYPLSSAAPRALRLAAEKLRDQGQWQQAASLFRRAARLSDDPHQLALIYGSHVRMLAEAERIARARRVLRGLMVRYPDLRPYRGGRPVRAEAWLEQLLARPRAPSPRRPRIHPPLETTLAVLEGRLLLPEGQDPRAMPKDRFLLYQSHPARLEMRRADDLSVVWTRPIPDTPVQLLGIENDRLLLWYPQSERLELRDATDGGLRWSSSSLSRLLATIGEGEGERRTPQQVRFRRLLGPQRLRLLGPRRSAQPSRQREVFIEANNGSLALASRKGRVMVIGARKGGVLWQARTGIQEVTSMRLEGGYLLLAGKDQDRAPVLRIYDAITGHPVHRLIEPQGREIMWMSITPAAMLVYLTPSQVVAFDLVSQQVRWTTRLDETQFAPRKPVIGLRYLTVLTQEEDLLWLDLRNGEVVNRLPLDDPRSTAEFTVRFAGGLWLLLGRERALVTSAKGEILWRAAISGERNFTAHALSDRYLILVNAPARRLGPEGRLHHLYLLDRQTGVIRFEQEIVAPGVLNRILVIQDKLLLGTQSMTGVLGEG